MKSFSLLAFFFLLLASFSCNSSKVNKDSYEGSVTTSNYDVDTLPPPYATKSVQNFSEVMKWVIKRVAANK